MIEPLLLKSKLASNPSQKPQFPVDVSFNGRTYQLADPRATRALVALMDMNAVLGGAACHYGGPAAFAELMSALHGFVLQEAQDKNTNWFDLFHLVNDAGHCENGLYALKANLGMAHLTLQKLRGFRSLKSPLTGHGEAHLFPEGVLISNGPLGSALGPAQGLALADRLARRDRVTVAAISDGACMEGEAREVFASLPGLAQKKLLNPFVMIISDNNTKLSGRIDQESFSMKPTFLSLSQLGWDVIELKEAHDLTACLAAVAQAIERARQNPSRPVALHAHTIKGIGTKKTAESSSGAHGFPLKSAQELPAFLSEIYGGEKFPSECKLGLMS